MRGVIIVKTSVIVLGLIALVLAVAVFCVFRTKKRDDVALLWKPQGKVAVVFFSQSKVGNTRQIAEWISEATGGDLVEIERADPYPEPYGETLKAAQSEISSCVLPPIKPLGANLDAYDVVFVGSPVWYGTYAAPVGSFLKAVDLSGKTVVPFCTHGGGGEGRTFADVSKAVPSAVAVLPGFVARGSNQIERRLGVGVKRTTCKADVVNWLNGLAK